MNGFQLCTAIRSTDEGKSLVIFFMTTGEGKLSKPAIQCGADDFIEKFSGLRTLINRINLVMKNGLLIRKRISIINIGPWELNREDQTVLNQTHKIELSDLEFDLLYFLAQNAKRSIPIKSLNSVINSSYFFHKRKTITQSLQALAKKIGEGLIVFTGGHRVRLNS